MNLIKLSLFSFAILSTLSKNSIVIDTNMHMPMMGQLHHQLRNQVSDMQSKMDGNFHNMNVPMQSHMNHMHDHMDHMTHNMDHMANHMNQMNTHFQDVKINDMRNQVNNVHSELMKGVQYNDGKIHIDFDHQNIFKSKHSVKSQVLEEKSESGFRVASFIVAAVTVSMMM